MGKFRDQAILVFLSIIRQPYFWAYQLLAVSLLPALLVPTLYLLARHFLPARLTGADVLPSWWGGFLFLTVLLFAVSYRRFVPRENPYRRYTGRLAWVDAYIDRFIEWIGVLKFFHSPLCIVQDPGSYKVKGKDVRALLQKLQPGDMLLRGYDGYLDGAFIRWSSGGHDLGKLFTHAAIYVGDVDPQADRTLAANDLRVIDDRGNWGPASAEQKEKVRQNDHYFDPGPQRIVHALGTGVCMEDILTFTRCDYLVALRLPADVEVGTTTSAPAPFMTLTDEEVSIRAALAGGAAVPSARVIGEARELALSKLGSCYDFQFNDGKKHNRFSCSEFVYFCYKSVQAFLGLQLKRQAFLKIFFPRVTITPADIYDAAMRRGKLEVVWTSRSLQK